MTTAEAAEPDDVLALCRGCWSDAFPDREPYCMATGERIWEVCSACLTSTHAGIYVLAGDLDEALGYGVGQDP